VEIAVRYNLLPCKDFKESRVFRHTDRLRATLVKVKVT